MLNYRLEIVGDEFVTSIDHFDEFHGNLLFDRPIYRLMCTHMIMGNCLHSVLNLVVCWEISPPKLIGTESADKLYIL